MTYATPHWFRHSNDIAAGKLKANMHEKNDVDMHKQRSNL